MSYSFWEAVAETPWWTYWILFFLLYTGYLAKNPRTVMFKPLFLTQTLLMAAFILGTWTIIEFNMLHGLVFVTALTVGMLTGWLQFRYSGIKAIKETGRFYVPGSFGLLIFMLMAISLKYYIFGPHLLFDPTQPQQVFFLLGMGGLTTGFFAGRTQAMRRCQKQGPYIHGQDVRL